VEPSSATQVERRSMWAHPTNSTVGSALWRIQEEIGASIGQRSTAVALVPDDDDGAWAQLLRHGMVVGRWEAGSPCLEANELGSWVPRRALRPSCLVLFPRAAGAHGTRGGWRAQMERAVAWRCRAPTSTRWHAEGAWAA
jgi:hypothetical protein